MEKCTSSADTEQNKGLAGVQNSQNIFHMLYSVTTVTGSDFKGEFIDHKDDLLVGWDCELERRQVAPRVKPVETRGFWLWQ